MTKIKFKDESELEFLVVNGKSIFHQNANRDSLEFIFDGNNSMDELASIFSNEEKTSIITIVENENTDDAVEYVYKDYNIQISVKKENVILEKESSESPEVSESRISITMGQLTYTEKLLKQLLNN